MVSIIFKINAIDIRRNSYIFIVSEILKIHWNELSKLSTLVIAVFYNITVLLIRIQFFLSFAIN